MRTTIELEDRQRIALATLAAERGLRGISPLIREAVDTYLANLAPEQLDAFLALRGSVGEDDAEALERHVADVRSEVWPSR